MPVLSPRISVWISRTFLLGLAACHSSGPTSPPTPAATPPPLSVAQLSDLSASTDSPEAGKTINCRNDVVAQVTVTNHGSGSFGVVGVRKSSQVLGGGCFAAPDFTYSGAGIGIGPGESVLVMNRALYQGGSGCCTQSLGCDGMFTCTFEEDFTVITSVGGVPAGSFSYDVNFNNCSTCASASAASVNRCRPPGH